MVQLCKTNGGSMIILLRIVSVFFSSRRRHTRLQGDWSSDVCSSDLGGEVAEGQQADQRAFELAHTLRGPLGDEAQYVVGQRGLLQRRLARQDRHPHLEDRKSVV